MSNTINRKRPVDSQSPDDMKVKAKKKRPLFTQKYWQRDVPHADYLHGNPDSRRPIA